MVSSPVPVSALNWSTASRRLPLPRLPSSKVVGVIVDGRQRSSKRSIRNRLREQRRARGQLPWPAAGRRNNLLSEFQSDMCEHPRSWLLEITVRDDFTPGPRDQPGHDADVHAHFQEMHRAVHKYSVCPAAMEGIDLVVVGAVEGTLPRLRHPVVRRALKDD